MTRLIRWLERRHARKTRRYTTNHGRGAVTTKGKR